MRDGGVVVDIDSKSCEGGETEGKDGRTRWHAGMLGLVFGEVPCEWSGEGKGLYGG